MLDELDALGLRNDTLVVMLSDHGWHLGEYAMWEKRTVWELGTRVPMMIRVPWLAEYEATRESFRRTVKNAEACNISYVTPWLWLGGGERRLRRNFEGLGGGCEGE